ncbi:MAG: SCO family protein [Stellaceae bacterium]
MSPPLRPSDTKLSRRVLLLGGLGLGAAALVLSGCAPAAKWHAIDVSGSSPALQFAMTRVGDGKPVTAADYRGKIVMLYLGYTNCPDVCPTTLANLGEVLERLGPDADRIRMLFVTVDPNRDTPAVLKEYVEDFAPQIDGLRGTADQLEALARRYRLVYSVEPETKDHPYEVTHSSAIYVFDGSGAARLLVASLSTTTPDIAGTAADLKRLVEAQSPPGFFARLLRLV